MTDRTILQSLKHLLARIILTFRIPVPKKTRRRARRLIDFHRSWEIGASLFANTHLIQTAHHVWRVEPMPSREALDFYYSHEYWSNRRDAKTFLRKRDLQHFMLLKESIRLRESNSQLKAVNFGSGHGGISLLLMAAGLDVVNVDMFDSETPGCKHVNHLSDVQGPVDLIYASHSLEHVTDVKQTLDSFETLLQPGGYLFIEVPNSSHPLQSTVVENLSVPKIMVPHTFYFSECFFKTINFEIVRLEVIDTVIRFLGNKKE